MKVSLLNENEEESSIGFEVSDTGIGIPQDKLESIFDNFQQATTGTTRLYGGTGLGLAIVKQLVEAQGGQIKVKSKENVGSTFSFILKFKKTTAKVGEDMDMHNEIKFEKRLQRILVVEDVKLNQLLMKTLLKEYGFETEIAANGKLAIEKLKVSKFDLVLMDLQMPEMNGFEATEHIRKIMMLDIPIIALTADVTTVDFEKCKAIGMNDYISKPIDEKLLYNKLMKFLKENEQGPDGLAKHNELEKTSGKVTNLLYIEQLTSKNKDMMLNMIRTYLEETPVILKNMSAALQKEDWAGLGALAHSLVPSFAMIGMNEAYEEMARKIQDYSSSQEKIQLIPELVSKVQGACHLAINELQYELQTLEVH